MVLLLISIVVPAYNEAERIAPTLKELDRRLRRARHEIIVVVDGTDSTAKVVKNLKMRGTRVLQFNHRLGKGGALKEGFKAAKGSVIVMYDADGAMPASELPKLLDALDGNDVAIGSRYSDRSSATLSLPRKIAAFIFNRLARLLFFLPFSDTQCGFKAFKAKAAKTLAKRTTTKGFVWDVEMLYLARKLNYRVAEVPVTWEEKEGGVLAKTTFRSGLRILLDVVALRLKYA